MRTGKIIASATALACASALQVTSLQREDYPMNDYDDDWGYHGEYFPPDLGLQSYNELSSKDFNDFLIKLLKGF